MGFSGATLVGKVLNEGGSITGLVIDYPSSTQLVTVKEVRRQLYTLDIKGLSLVDGALRTSKYVDRYSLEGLTELNNVLYRIASSKFKRDLNIIEELTIETVLDLQFGGIKLVKEFRSPALFTDYDYENSGYSEAEFIGEELLNSALKDIGNNVKVSYTAQEKLWVRLEIDCSQISSISLKDSSLVSPIINSRKLNLHKILIEPENFGSTKDLKSYISGVSQNVNNYNRIYLYYNQTLNQFSVTDEDPSLFPLKAWRLIIDLTELFTQNKTFTNSVKSMNEIELESRLNELYRTQVANKS